MAGPDDPTIPYQPSDGPADPPDDPTPPVAPPPTEETPVEPPPLDPPPMDPGDPTLVFGAPPVVPEPFPDEGSIPPPPPPIPPPPPPGGGLPPEPPDDLEEGWWAQRTTGERWAIAAGIILLGILIAVLFLPGDDDDLPVGSTTTLLPGATTTTGGDTTTTEVRETTTSTTTRRGPDLPSVDGSGPGAVDFAIPGDLAAAVEITHDGASPFVVRALDDEGDEVAVLIERVGAYTGTVGVNLDTDLSPVASLEFIADGDWSAEAIYVNELGPTTLGGSTGSTDSVLWLDPHLDSDEQLTFSHNGTREFIVVAYSTDRNASELIGAFGEFSGPAVVASGTAVVTIRGDGDWTITGGLRKAQSATVVNGVT